MLTVSIAVHNPNIDMFSKMLKSLKKYTPELSQLIVIDNNSDKPDKWIETVRYIFKEGPELTFIYNNKNVGFGEAHNEALTKATGKYFAVLNDDIEFFTVWSTPMIELLRTDALVGQVCPKGSVCNTIARNGQGVAVDTDDPDYAEGSCFMMRTPIAKEYGLFDTDTYKFAYCEDTDLSLRLRKAGYKMRNVDIGFKHYRAVTSSKVKEDFMGFYVRNSYEFRRRWMSYILAKKFGPCIVIRRTGSYGDVFLTLPVAKALREKYKDCAIVLLTSCPDAVLYSSEYDMIIKEPYAPFPCDIFIGLDNAYEKDFRRNIVDCYAEVAGVEVDNRLGTISVSPKEFAKVEKFLKGMKEFVAVDVGNTWPEKQWHVEYYRELVKRLKADGQKVVLIGLNPSYTGLGAMYIDADLDFVNTLTILETAVLIQKAKLFVGNEGLLLHLAQAAGIHSIGLYGCTLPEYVNEERVATLHPVISPAECVGCRHRYASGNSVKCPRGAKCMEMITFDQVWDKYIEIKEVI